MAAISKKARWPLVGAVAVALGCAHGDAASGRSAADARAAIEALNQEFSAAMRRGDAAAVAALFTEDGEVASPTAKGFIAGRPALLAYYTDRLRAARYLELLVITSSLDVEGDLAWTTGTNRSVIQVGDATPATRSGRYLAVLRRGADGRWRYRVDAIIPDPAG